MLTTDEALVINQLAESIYHELRLQCTIAQTPGVEAKQLIKRMRRHHVWEEMVHHFYGHDTRGRLIKVALGRLKDDGRLISEPRHARYARRDRKTGRMVKPIVAWIYKAVDNPLEAIAALNPLEQRS